MSLDDVPKEVRVARIGRPHGIRGEVTVEIFTEAPEKRFQIGNVVTVRATDQRTAAFETLTVERARWNKRILLLKFEEIRDRSCAESMRNMELYVAASDQQDDESWYADELIGLTVHVGTLSSASIGEVTDLITGHVQDLLKVRLLNGQELLIPFVEEIVPAIYDGLGAIVIDPPAGLLELTQE